MDKPVNAVLLGIIALLLAVQTFMQFAGNDKGTSTPAAAQASTVNTQLSNPVANATPAAADPSSPTINFDDPAPGAEEGSIEGPYTSIAFAEESHDFGTIKEGEKVKHTFKFTNTGDNPLIIHNAKGSCGCTVPAYSKDPIAPGGTGEIEVEFDSKNKEGVKNNSVTITANTEPNNTYIRISANVVKEGSGS